MNLFVELSNNVSLFTIAVGVFSLLVGSFLNVVIQRLPIMMEREWKIECTEFLGGEIDEGQRSTYNLFTPRSQCMHCGHQISALENIPLISFFLLLRGKCKGCKQPISMQYPAIELATAVLSMVLAYSMGPGFLTIATIACTWALIVLFMIDAKTMYLPDSITLPLMWAGILLSYFGQGFVSLESSVIGAMVGYLSLWSVYQLFRLLTGKEGMGFGDFKLLAAIGAWGGWQVLPFVIFSSAAIGSIFGIFVMLYQRDKKSAPMPFGPWLALTAYLALLFHEKVLFFTRFYIPSI